MKDLGLVHVWGNGIDLGGPVAVLLETPTHFLGAIIEDKNGEKLVLHLLPKSAISKSTGWQRGAPYSERLLRHVATLDAVAAKGQGDQSGETVRIEDAPPQPYARSGVVRSGTRVYSRHGVTVLPARKDDDQEADVDTPKKPPTSPEVAAVKADLSNIMGKYEQIVKKKD